MKYKYHAKCSQCGRGFRSNTRSDLLARLRKHLWSKHGSWMKARIKGGLKKAKKKRGNLPAGLPNFPEWIGFAEKPVIEKITGRPYEEVKSIVLDFFVRALLGGVKKP